MKSTDTNENEKPRRGVVLALAEHFQKYAPHILEAQQEINRIMQTRVDTQTREDNS